MTNWFCKSRRILTSLRRINLGGSCNFYVYISTCGTSGSALQTADRVTFVYIQRAVLAALCVVQNKSIEMVFIYVCLFH